MHEYYFDECQVDAATYGFGFMFRLCYDNNYHPHVSPVSGDIIHFCSRNFKVDVASDFGDSYDMLCVEVR